MRKAHKGVTMVVSPLLVLMENQLEAASKMGLRCEVLNSTVKDRRSQILDSLENDQLDLILVTPETLFSDEVQKRLRNIKIGLFVIDEAHCISDWGHDFRLEYGNLKAVIASLPPAVPILATTATANDRVIQDLEKQLGSNVFISRGPLTRESLSIQVLNMPDRITRYAWILENIKKLPDSGIIYCLTQRDCDYLSDFLQKNGIQAEAYYSRGSEEGKLLNQQIEERFQRNEIKAITNKQMLLLSVVKPDAPFHVGVAMMRNRYIYAQSSGTVVVRSDYNKGGTWAGATENLRHNWCTTLCWDKKSYKGNKELILQGAIAIDETWDGDVASICTAAPNTDEQLSLFEQM